MIIKSGYTKEGLVKAVEVTIQKRDLIKIFATVVVAEMLCHTPVAKKRVDEMSRKIAQEVENLRKEKNDGEA
jgi:hypothetical protein